MPFEGWYDVHPVDAVVVCGWIVSWNADQEDTTENGWQHYRKWLTDTTDTDRYYRYWQILSVSVSILTDTTDQQVLGSARHRQWAVLIHFLPCETKQHEDHRGMHHTRGGGPSSCRNGPTVMSMTTETWLGWMVAAVQDSIASINFSRADNLAESAWWRDLTGILYRSSVGQGMLSVDGCW